MRYAICTVQCHVPIKFSDREEYLIGKFGGKITTRIFVAAVTPFTPCALPPTSNYAPPGMRHSIPNPYMLIPQQHTLTPYITLPTQNRWKYRTYAMEDAVDDLKQGTRRSSWIKSAPRYALLCDSVHGTRADVILLLGSKIRVASVRRVLASVHAMLRSPD